jgi:hypothetical protein|tara:strand:- start:1682 stop:2125 length:444 start_codon:yes stop_codon:yes gene_type:complete
MMRELKIFFTAMFIFALLAAWAPRANAADTSDVIGALLFGGWLGSEIQKDRRPIEPYVTHFPHGTIIVPGFKQRTNMQCFFEIEADGMPKYAVPNCSTTGSSYYNRHTNTKILQQDMYPCGSYWGYGCQYLVQKLKAGTITGVFNFN